MVRQGKLSDNRTFCRLNPRRSPGAPITTGREAPVPGRASQQEHSRPTRIRAVHHISLRGNIWRSLPERRMIPRRVVSRCRVCDNAATVLRPPGRFRGMKALKRRNAIVIERYDQVAVLRRSIPSKRLRDLVAQDQVIALHERSRIARRQLQQHHLTGRQCRFLFLGHEYHGDL